MVEHFGDGSSFMIKNGRVAYQTKKSTWLEVFMNGLFLDDFYSIKLTFHRFGSISNRLLTDVRKKRKV
jgi:hypothetical protein